MSTASQAVAKKTGVSLGRKIVLIVMIATYSISAIIGIVTILSFTNGSSSVWADSETEWRTIATTALIGTSSLIILCALAVANIKTWRILGWVTGATGFASALLTLFFVWGVISYDRTIDSYSSYSSSSDNIRWLTMDAYENLIKLDGVLWVWSFILVFTCLLIAATHGLSKIATAFAYISSGLGMLNGVIITYLVFIGTEDSFNLESLIKTVAVTSILAVLGTLITLTLALVQRTTAKKQKPVQSATSVVGVQVPASDNTQASYQSSTITEHSLSLLQERSKERGLDINDYVERLLIKDED